MSGLFSYDNKIFSGIDKIINLFYISILWVIFSLPIFTIGASTTALYYTVNKVLKRNTGYVFAEFWHAFKTNFKQATLLWLIVGGIGAILGMDMYLVSHNPKIFNKFSWINVLFIMVMFLDIIWGLYIFPYLARFENSNKQIMKNAAIIACVNFPKTILLFILFIVSALLVYLIGILVILIPALSTLGMSYIYESVFRKYMTDEQRELEDEKDDEDHNPYR